MCMIQYVKIYLQQLVIYYINTTIMVILYKHNNYG